MADFGDIIDNAARSDNINQSGLVLDIEARTAHLDPNEYIFLALMRKLGAPIVATRMKHEYRERRLIPNYTTLTAAAAVGATSLTVAQWDRIKNDFLLYIPATGDMYLVQDGSIDTTVSIVRASTGSGGVITAIDNNEKVVILGEAHAEGEAVPAAYTNKSVDAFDYAMQMDRMVQATDIEEAIEHYDDSEKLAYDRKQAWIEYQRCVNLLYYVGKKSRETTSASGPRRHCCGGVFEKFTEHQVDCSGGDAGFTYQTLGMIMGLTKYYGASSNRKVGLFGTNGWEAISSWPINYLRVSPMTKTWGIAVNEILTGYGAIDVGFDPVLTADKGLADRGIIIDPAWVRRGYLRGMKPRMHINIQTALDIHNKKDAISGTFFMQAKFNELHAQCEGIE